MENGSLYVALFILIGALFVVLGIPLKQGRIPPNYFYGFRTPRTLRDEKVWYPANRVLGIDMIRGGVVIVAGALVMLALRGFVAAHAAVLVLVGISIAVALFMGIHGFAVLRKL
jgi:uncharacterized membrane protein